jgi:hypothetical protein
MRLSLNKHYESVLVGGKRKYDQSRANSRRRRGREGFLL